MFDKLPFRLLVRELRRMQFSPALDAGGRIAEFEMAGSPAVGTVKFRFAGEGEYIVAIAELMPRPAPADRPAILQLIALANRNVLVGRFDLDLADGELRFFAALRSSAFLLRPKRETENALGLLGTMSESFVPAALATLTGLRTPLEAYLATDAGKHWRETSPDAVKAVEEALSQRPVRPPDRAEGVSAPAAVAVPHGAIATTANKPVAGGLELVKDYSLAPLNVHGIIPLAKIETAVGNYLAALDRPAGALPLPDRPHMNILLSGPPGTGKSEFVRYLGAKFGLPVVVRTAGDLLDKYVGNTEKFIREAFAEASKTRSILFLDDFDGILHNREDATQGWQLSHTNEILRAMEEFRGVVVAATNLAERLDPAVLRRFTYKFEFDFLTPEGKRFFFKRAFDSDLTDQEATRLNSIPDLAPGDFRTISQGLFFLGEETTNEMRLDALAREAEMKNRNWESWKRRHAPRIGFAPNPASNESNNPNKEGQNR